VKAVASAAAAANSAAAAAAAQSDAVSCGNVESELAWVRRVAVALYRRHAATVAAEWGDPHEYCDDIRDYTNAHSDVAAAYDTEAEAMATVTTVDGEAAKTPVHTAPDAPLPLHSDLCAGCACAVLGDDDTAARINRGALKRCTACLNVAYCSRPCQTAHWRQHKTVCKAAVAAAKKQK
jgi:hypothetical protein